MIKIADSTKVVVICLAYNHARYIKSALEGFLGQETNFNFEIVVHDDCSTDETYEIVSSYSEVFSGKLHVLRPEVNQYSKGVKVTKKILSYIPDDCYVAFCEGDDYWIDKYKLQKQYDFLESHAEYAACIHQAYLRNAKTLRLEGLHSSYPRSMKLETRDIILADGGGFASASMFFRKHAAVDYLKWKSHSVGDFPLMISLSLYGPVWYFSDKMAVYRAFSVGSWTERVHSNVNLERQFASDYCSMLNDIDSYTNYAFHNEIELRKQSTMQNYEMKWHVIEGTSASGLSDFKPTVRQRLIALSRRMHLYDILKHLKSSVVSLVLCLDFLPGKTTYESRIEKVIGLFGKEMN